MQQDKMFQELVDKGSPVGEIIGIDSFLVKVRGLQPCNVHALIRFQDGSKGYVHHVYEDYVVVMRLGTTVLSIGMICAIQHTELLTKVGKNYVGRVVNIFGEPIDGKGPIEPDAVWEVFHNAPMLYERKLLDHQLETGITLLDINFSLVRGQRMAVLGDGKSGKTAMTTQIAINQKNTDITVIYVLIAKRQRDVAQLVDRLEKNEALGKAIIIVTNMFESLVSTYLAPYIGAAHGEYFWQQLAMDTLVIYDDLTSHAQAYREISLIAGVSPGRDSYPGDMFYTHSSLVERAGRLDRNSASQTILPIIYAPAGDITAYLPTNVMSMTDGQWILDMAIFKDTMRPAISTGLSVTRVGGVGQNKRQKGLAAQLNKTLAGYRVAEEYAHFGTELSPEAQADYDKGKALFQLMNQDIGEGYNLTEQQFLLDLVLGAKEYEKIDIKKMKSLVKEVAAQLQEDKDLKGNFDSLRDGLKAQVVIVDEKLKAQREAEAKAAAEKAAAAVEEAPAEGVAAEGDKKDGKDGDKKDEKDKDDKKPDDKDEKRDGKEDKKDDKPAEVKSEEKPAEADKTKDKPAEAPKEAEKDDAKEPAEAKK
ncbi:MAG TPA: sodium-transporting two-sector ATPase [Candidatus Saccharimonadales bacterium]|nr:sodium-transporting two-sector ATPase [Candidatus Saccharimonadales bacterium]